MQKYIALSLKDTAERFLEPLVCLHKADTGRSFLERLAEGINARVANTLGSLEPELPHLQYSTPFLWSDSFIKGYRTNLFRIDT